MSKRLKPGKGKTRTTAKSVVRKASATAASVLNTVGSGRAKAGAASALGSHRGPQATTVKRTQAVPLVTIQVSRRADPSLLDPYDWGPEGVPKGQPLRYVAGQGFVLED